MSTKFYEMLELLATLGNVALTPGIIGLYEIELTSNGLDEAAVAMRKLAAKTNARTGLPTIDQIREAMGISPMNDEDEAREASARIISAVSRYGWNNPDAAAEFIGDLGWHVVGLAGGWLRVCEMANEQVTTFQGQFRELAKVQLKRARLGVLESPPPLPPAAGKSSKPQLIGEIVKLSAYRPCKQNPPDEAG